MHARVIQMNAGYRKDHEPQPDVVHAYPAGSWGPEEANRLFENPDQAWRDQV
jgi:glucose-6-phosphate 1-dehydrogenase